MYFNFSSKDTLLGQLIPSRLNTSLLKHLLLPKSTILIKLYKNGDKFFIKQNYFFNVKISNLRSLQNLI
jgi:hypothetical protein